jgi:hypothetical protein
VHVNVLAAQEAHLSHDPFVPHSDPFEHPTRSVVSVYHGGLNSLVRSCAEEVIDENRSGLGGDTVTALRWVNLIPDLETAEE